MMETSWMIDGRNRKERKEKKRGWKHEALGQNVNEIDERI